MFDDKWMMKHRGLVQHGAAILIFALGVVLGFVSIFHEGAADKLLLGFVVGTAVVTTLLAFVIYYIVTILLFEINTRSTHRVYVEPFSNAVSFAKKRLDIVLKMKPEEMIYPVYYYSSRCSTFTSPDGFHDEHVELTGINEALVTRLAELATARWEGGTNRGVLRLLIQADTEEQLELELTAFVGHFQKTFADWDRYQFDVRIMSDKTMKDYFVIEDHLFKVIRRSDPENRTAQFVHIESKQLADGYREWLADIFVSGHVSGHTRDPSVTAKVFGDLINFARSKKG